jgi:hypothetical protein
LAIAALVGMSVSDFILIAIGDYFFAVIHFSGRLIFVILVIVVVCVGRFLFLFFDGGSTFSSSSPFGC